MRGYVELNDPPPHWREQMRVRYVWIYVCMVIIYSKGKDQPSKIANPVRGQLNREN